MAENREYIVQSAQEGSVSISDDVIAIIAWEAMQEVEGFGGPAAGISAELMELMGRRNASRGVRITKSGDSVAIDLYVMVRYGFSVTKTARKLQGAVLNAVTDMTGITVSSVNVNVSGIHFDKSEQV